MTEGELVMYGPEYTRYIEKYPRRDGLRDRTHDVMMIVRGKFPDAKLDLVLVLGNGEIFPTHLHWLVPACESTV